MSLTTQWMSDSRLADIRPEKLSFLQKLFFDTQKLTEKERLPFFLSLATKSKTSSIQFSESELKLIMSVIRDYATPEEIKKMNQLSTLVKTNKKDDSIS